MRRPFAHKLRMRCPTAGATLLSTLACALFLILLPGTLHAVEPIVVAEQGRYSLAGHLEMQPDPAASLTIADVIRPGNTRAFKPLDGFLNRGYISGATWLHFTITPSTAAPSENLYLLLEPSYLDQVTVYVQNGHDPTVASSYIVHDLGDHTPVARLPLSYPDMLAPLSLQNTREHHVYIRVQTTSSHVLKGELVTAPELVVGSVHKIMFGGGYLALTLAFCILNLAIAIRLRESLYGIYSAYLLTLFLMFVGRDGLLKVLWPDRAHLLADHCSGIGLGMGTVTITIFFMRMFSGTTRFPRMRLYFWGAIALGVATTVASGTAWYGTLATLTIYNAMLLFVILFSLSVILYRQRTPGAGLFMMAFFPMFLGANITILRIIGVLPFNWLTFYSYQLSTAIHILLMSLALCERVLRAEESALEASRETENRATALAEQRTAELQEKQRQLEWVLTAEQDARAEQGRFIDMVSHEYRTPLSVIQTNMEILGLGDLNERQRTTSLEKMAQGIRRLRELFDNYLHQSELKRRFVMTPVQLDFKVLLAQCLEEAGRMWGVRRFQLLTEGAGDEVTLEGDRAMLQTALVNLLDNGAKYSPPLTPIIVTMHRQGPDVVVRIENRLASRGQIDVDRVFDKYYRGGNSTGAGGTGVGLYLVRRIVEAHGGSIVASVTSSRFVIDMTLPLRGEVLEQ